MGLTQTYLQDTALGADARPGGAARPAAIDVPTGSPADLRADRPVDPVVGLPVGLPVDLAVDLAVDLIGQRIGSYRITRELGHGGMGVVYEAVHDQLGQRAAVKTLKRELSLSQAYAQRFFTEARALSIAQHPSLVKIFDFGQLPDKTLYILMEFLEGEALSSRLERGPLDEAGALRLTRQIAAAVSAAHERSIIHRDLKPANIFVVPDPEASAGERVKILDFGLARIAQESAGSGGGPRQTATGAIMGTPVYMSPEQCRGLYATDGKTDVYALGVLLFEMLAGSPPFVADTAGDLIAMHIGQTPPALRRKVPTASAAVATLVADMLSKEAASRPTMAQVTQRLLQVTATGQPLARSTEPSARRWLLGAGVAAVVVAGTIGSRFIPRPNQPIVALSTPRPQPVAAPRTVWVLTSDPIGAAVRRSADQVPLGHTPWRQEQDAGAGQVAVWLEHPGYVRQEVALENATSMNRHIVLARSPQAAMVPPPDPVPGPVPGPVSGPVPGPSVKPPGGSRSGGRVRGAKSPPPVLAQPGAPLAQPQSPSKPLGRPPVDAAPPTPVQHPLPSTGTTPEDTDVPALR